MFTGLSICSLASPVIALYGVQLMGGDSYNKPGKQD